MNKNVFLIIILLIFAVSGSIFSQNVHDLRIGTFLSGYLNPGQEVWYRVPVTAGLGLLIVETKGEIDTYLEIYDAQRNLINENDDGDDLNAKIIILAGNDTNYLFKLKGYDIDVAGPFRIYASFSALTNHTVLRVNSVLSGYIESGRNYLYIVQPDKSGVLNVRTSGDIVDTVMQAYDGNFIFLSENDDISGDDDTNEHNYNSHIYTYVNAGQNYYFLVRGFNEEEIGSYQIYASIAASDELRADSSLTGHLESGGSNWYCVQAVRNGSLVVEIYSNFDSFIEVYDEKFSLIAVDDDGGTDLNALVEINVKEGMTYYFLVSGYSTDDAGAFRITARSR